MSMNVSQVSLVVHPTRTALTATAHMNAAVNKDLWRKAQVVLVSVLFVILFFQIGPKMS